MNKEISEIFQDYRPEPQYPVYPPYHTGFYLEDYFYDWYCRNSIETDRVFIPVSWTTCYIDQKTQGLQEALNKLNPNDRYNILECLAHPLFHSLSKKKPDAKRKK